MCLNAWPIGSDTIRWCGLLRIGVALLEKVCHCGDGLWGSVLKLHPVWESLFLAAFRSGYKTSAPQHRVCLHAAMVPAKMVMDWPSENVSQTQLNVFLYKRYLFKDFKVLYKAMETLTKTWYQMHNSYKENCSLVYHVQAHIRERKFKNHESWKC